uniref:RING-type E3 ubiquitin transferase n=1 Tax=Rhabditophanes sp. KR3021 TaxID=114890 RepID=A0AC35UA66_9BILA
MSSIALEYKAKGNRLFQEAKYELALGFYTKAIIQDPSVSIFYSNRALCYLHLKQWEKSAEDARKCLEVEKKNVKARVILGKALLQLGEYDEAIKSFNRALENSKETSQFFGDEICAPLREARRLKFREEEKKRMAEEIVLQSYITQLMRDDTERKIAEILPVGKVYGSLTTVDTEGSEKDEVTEKMEELQSECESNIIQLNNLFAQVDDRRKKREIPDYLCGKISFELLRNPVVTSSGFTYDRDEIKEHLNRVGHFDPMTRAPLTEDQLIPNLAMKEVLDNFLSENEWALDA